MLYIVEKLQEHAYYIVNFRRAMSILFFTIFNTT